LIPIRPILEIILQEFPVYYRMDYLDIDVDKERQMAGLQSMINGWTIEIQMLELKIEEVKKQLDNIKKVSSR